MSEQKYTYEAFISYRHNARDGFIAKTISKLAEGYTIPTPQLRKELGKKKIGRLFRDEDELPFGGVLNDAIAAAIRNSRKFIMLLNHDYLDEGHWCIYELAEFLRTHHYSDVVVVVTSGNIAELTKATAELMQKKGLRFYNETDETGKPLDPFAIELTAYQTEKEIGKALKNMRLKLLAGILGIDYDDLNRREHRRQVKRRWAILSPIFLAISAFAVTVTLLAMNINRQRLVAQNNEMSLLLESSKTAVADGNRLAGIRHALDALDICTGLYPAGNAEKSELIRQSLDGAVYCQGFQLLMPVQNNSRKFSRFLYSPDNRYMLSVFGEYTAVLLDAYTGEIIKEITRNRPYMDSAVSFYGFSPSGEFFVTGFGYYTCEIVVWSTGAEPEEIASHSVDEKFIEGGFASDNEIIFGRRPFVKDEMDVWDVGKDTVRAPTNKEDRVFADERAAAEEANAGQGALISPDGTYRFVYDMNSEEPVTVYETSTGLAVGELPGMNIIAGFSHDGRYVVAGNGSGVCGIFSMPGSATAVVEDAFEGEVYQYPAYFEGANVVALTLETAHMYEPQLYPGSQPFMLNEPSGRFLAMVYPDSFVEVWDLEKDSVHAAYGLREHIGRIQQAGMTSEVLVTAGYDGRIMVFDLKTGLLRNSFSVENGIASMNFDPAGTKTIAVGRSARHAYVYDLATGLPVYRLDAEPGTEIDYTSIGFSEDGSLAIAKQKNGRVIVATLFLSLDELIRFAQSAVA